MSRLTVRLPETLHQQLTDLAEGEGVSLNQYIVYALTRQAALASTLRKRPGAEVEHQQQMFQLLIQQLGQASSVEIESTLAAREQALPEPDLSADIVERLRERIRKQAMGQEDGS